MDFGAITWVTTVIGVVVLFFVVRALLKALLKGTREESVPDTHVHKECAECGWEGMVSKYHKKCANCGADLY